MSCPICGAEMVDNQICINCGNGTIKKVSRVSKGFAIASLIFSLILLISYAIFIIKPLFYVVQSYCGGCYTDEEVLEITIDESGSLERHEKTEMEARVIVGGGIAIFLIASFNAWICVKRLNKNCIKSPVNKAVGCFGFNLFAVAPIAGIKLLLDFTAKQHEILATDGSYMYKEMNAFNIFDFMVYVGIVTVLISLINIFTAVSAKKSVKKASKVS